MIRQEQCDKVCRILDDVLANRPTERDSLIVATRKAFEALEGTKWIPSSERLPEKYIGQWLCCTSDGDVMILPYDTPGDGTKECAFYKWDDDGYFYQIFDVIAWMPLPEPYRGEGS